MTTKVVGCGWLIATLLSAVAFTSCAATGTSSRTAEQRDALIEQLENAKRTDLQEALAPGIMPIPQGDFMISAGMANTAIEKLRHDEYISQAEIDEALVVPPKSLSIEERTYLIQQLEAAIAMDNQGFNDYPRDPVKEEDFQVQARMAEQTVKQLRNGDTVSWWAIQRALYIPSEP